MITFLKENGTFREGDKMSESMLKIIIINSKTCVYYAGNVEYANTAIKEIFDTSETNESKIVEILKKCSLESDKKTTFGIASISKENKVSQKKIIGEEVIDCNKSFLYLGSNTAIEKFKKNYTQNMHSGMDEKKSIVTSFKKVINDSDIKGVGHFLIQVNSTDKILRNEVIFDYNVSTEISLNKRFTVPPKTGMVFPVKDTKKDLSGFVSFTSVSTDYFALAIYSINENKGILFCPQLEIGQISKYEIVAVKELKEEAQNFIDRICKEYKIPLRGLIYSFDGTFGYKMIESCEIDKSKFYPDMKIELSYSVNVSEGSHGIIKVLKNGKDAGIETKF